MLVLGGIVLGAFTVALTHKEPRVKRVGLWRTRRVVRSTKVSPIAELEDGKLACVVGKVELDGDGLISVVSRRTCVADPAARDADEHHFRHGATAATLTGTAKWPLLVDRTSPSVFAHKKRP